MFLKFEEHSSQKALVFEEIDVSSDDSGISFQENTPASKPRDSPFFITNHDD